MLGSQLASKMHKIRPDIPIVLTTGFSETLVQEAEHTDAIVELVEKPYNQKILAKVISKALKMVSWSTFFGTCPDRTCAAIFRSRLFLKKSLNGLRHI